MEALGGFRPPEAGGGDLPPFRPWVHNTLEPTEAGFPLAHAKGLWMVHLSLGWRSCSPDHRSNVGELLSARDDAPPTDVRI